MRPPVMSSSTKQTQRAPHPAGRIDGHLTARSELRSQRQAAPVTSSSHGTSALCDDNCHYCQGPETD